MAYGGWGGGVPGGVCISGLKTWPACDRVLHRKAACRPQRSVPRPSVFLRHGAPGGTRGQAAGVLATAREPRTQPPPISIARGTALP